MATIPVRRRSTQELWNSTAGNTFTIINNDGPDPVHGTFAGLNEGATFTSDNVTYTVSYVGGNGNDVVLTALYATFVVTTTSDYGAGRLRQSILDANATSGINVISFNIPGTGVHTIAPASALPTVTGTVTIDGKPSRTLLVVSD